jgi:hypothetical protein
MTFEKPWGNYLLKNIIETQAPEAISYFPQTLGWKILLMIFIGFSIKKTWHSWKAYKSNAYRREALAWLQQGEFTDDRYLRQLPALLKKTATLAYKNSSLNQMSGNEWAAWLDLHCTKTQFNQKDRIKLLTQLPYKKVIDVNEQHITAFIEQVSLWVKYHQVSETTS